MPAASGTLKCEHEEPLKLGLLLEKVDRMPVRGPLFFCFFPFLLLIFIFIILQCSCCKMMQVMLKYLR